MKKLHHYYSPLITFNSSFYSGWAENILNHADFKQVCNHRRTLLFCYTFFAFAPRLSFFIADFCQGVRSWCFWMSLSVNRFQMKMCKYGGHVFLMSA